MGEGLAEEVLVVPRSVLEAVGVFQGFCGEVDRYLPALLDPGNTSWRTRAVVEEDPSFKQLIPYCVLRWQSDDGDPRYFAYTRGGGQQEARLRAKRSLGIGGHISSIDGEHGDDRSYEVGDAARARRRSGDCWWLPEQLCRPDQRRRHRRWQCAPGNPARARPGTA
jgi:Predicted phosphoesterase (MutT family)